MRKIKTILVGQSGGPTAAINASLAGVIRTAYSHNLRILGMRNGIQGFLEGRVADLTQALNLASSPNTAEQNFRLLRNTPSSWLGSCRFKLPEPDENPHFYQRITMRMNELGIDAILYIGGNDSMDTTDKLSRYFANTGIDVPVVGIPKTIDNDLEGTDHTPGFGSAARFVATVTAELTRDGSVYDTKNVTFIEAMGRDAGWLTAAGALAGDICGTAPDFILLPEVPLDEEVLLARIKARLAEKNNVVIVVSEGVHRVDGSFLFDSGSVATDTFGHLAAQSGTAAYLSRLTKTRGIELNTLQRCASHAASKVDLDEAEALGTAGIETALRRETGVMVGIRRLGDMPYTTEICTVPVADVANKVKLVPADMISSDGFNVTEAALRYLRPLAAGAEESIIVDGLPHFLGALDKRYV